MYKINVRYQYNFWHENMKNKVQVMAPMAPIFVNVPKCLLSNILLLKTLL
jgi:hypothetical protein